MHNTFPSNYHLLSLYNMTSSISDTTPSPTPFSPFSTHSGGSDLATSDESPDLGAFTTVFRAFQELQPRTFPIHLNGLSTTTPTTSSFSPTEESDPNGASTVWNRQDLASYLSFSSRDATSRRSQSTRTPPPSDTPSSDTEGEPILGDDEEIPPDQPSLGGFDAAIEFLAGERARFTARRDTALRGNSSTSDGAWEPLPAPPRRKRRRKKAKSLVRTLATRDGNDTHQSRTETLETEQDAEDESSSSPEVSSPSPADPKSIPATPIRRRRDRERSTRQTATATTDTHRLVHSRSTPSLRSAPLDPQVVRLRSLAMKLKVLFPNESDRLAFVLSNASLNASAPAFIDTRGPAARADAPSEPITHVFIDHSNILIGFLTYLRLHPHQLTTSKVKHLSHAALALVLERGRPVSRRVLAASSPLYQPIDAAEQLGYEVHVYARVPDTGDGPDRVRSSGGGGSNNNSSSNINTTNTQGAQWRGRQRRSGSGWTAPKGHARGPSGSGANATTGTPNGGSTESEPSSSSAPKLIPAQPAPSRVRYREQGVDELLQLKLHQALAGDAPPPPGSTIVLATGDGNVGQYNEEGFIGCVRLALKKRWRVELHAWEGGLSREWMRAFGEEGGFKIEAMDRFAADLLVA